MPNGREGGEKLGFWRKGYNSKNNFFPSFIRWFRDLSYWYLGSAHWVPWNCEGINKKITKHLSLSLGTETLWFFLIFSEFQTKKDANFLATGWVQEVYKKEPTYTEQLLSPTANISTTPASLRASVSFALTSIKYYSMCQHLKKLKRTLILIYARSRS